MFNKESFTYKALAVSIPTMIAFLSDYTYQLIDAYWVAKTGIGAPTAVVICGALLAMFLSINEIVGVGTIPVFTQQYGKKDYKSTEYVFFQGIFFKIILGILSGILFLFFINNFLGLYTDNKSVIDMAKSYGNVIWLSLIFIMPYATIFTALRTIGKAKWTMYISFVCTIINIIFDPILIYGFGDKAYLQFPYKFILGKGSDNVLGYSFEGLGIKGAAIATVITQGLCLFLAFICIVIASEKINIFKRAHLKIDFRLYKKLVLIGLPVGFVSILWNFEQNLIASFMTDYGIEISDGYGISQRVRGALMMGLFGLGIGSSIVSGSFIGAGKQEEVYRCMKRYVFTTMIFIGAIAIPMFFYSSGIVRFFVDNDISVKAGSYLLKLVCIMELIYMPSFMIKGAFEGAGKNVPLLILHSIELILIEIPLLYLSVKIFNAPFYYMHYIVIGVTAINTIITYILFKKKIWMIPSE